MSIRKKDHTVCTSRLSSFFLLFFSLFIAQLLRAEAQQIIVWQCVLTSCDFLMCNPGSVQRELEFGSFESYYLTWNDGSYGDGEPLPFNHDRLYEDKSFCTNEEQEDNHSTNTSYGHELLLPYDGGINNWFAEFESYLDGSWENDAVPSYVNCPEKSDDLFAGEVIQHDSHYADDPQGLWQLDAGYRDEDYNYHVRQVSEAARADSWDEMRLVESIFGHWPKLDLEDRTEPAVA